MKSKKTTAPKKAPAKKATAPKKTPAKKAPAKQATVARKAPAKQATVARKAPAKQATVARKAPAKKTTVAKKAPAKKTTVAKKAPATKATVAKKAPATKATVAMKAPVTKASTKPVVSAKQSSPSRKRRPLEVRPKTPSVGKVEAPLRPTPVKSLAPTVADGSVTRRKRGSAVLPATSTRSRSQGAARTGVKRGVARPSADVASERIDGGEALSKGYGENRIVLMVRDPYWLFTYWELSDDYMKRSREEAGPEARFTLRVYDVTGLEHFDGSNALRQVDIEVPEARIGNWYVNVWGADRQYLVEVGFLPKKKGSFSSITRSNEICTPRETLSDVVGDEEWASVDGEYEQMFQLSGGEQAGQSSAVDVKERLARHLEENQLSSQAPSSWTSPTGAAPGSVPPGWSGDVVRGGASSMMRPRPGAPVPSRGRHFWLVVNTELIVYGATMPDAAVTVQGKTVTLRPDGTFSLRFALPDGKQVIPVRAVSADGKDERCITPVVEKATR